MGAGLQAQKLSQHRLTLFQASGIACLLTTNCSISLRLAQVLLAAGADPWVVNQAGKTPLMLAADRGLATARLQQLFIHARGCPRERLAYLSLAAFGTVRQPLAAGVAAGGFCLILICIFVGHMGALRQG
jgi:hypothetical protein